MRRQCEYWEICNNTKDKLAVLVRGHLILAEDKYYELLKWRQWLNLARTEEYYEQYYDT